jgi:dTDP-L-rhamnose 4-epimerase
MVVYGEGRSRCPAHGPVAPRPRAPCDLDAACFDPRCPVDRCGRFAAWEPVTEDTPPDPRNVYAATKLHQEQLCALYGREISAVVVALRYHNVYGPRMPRDTPYAGVASIFRSALEAGRPPEVFEDGGQTRDFVHVRDVARANVLALTSPSVPPGPYNVASGEPHTVGDMAVALAAGCGTGLSPVVNGRWRMGDVRHVVASPARAADRLGFRAEIGFADGMAEFATAPLRG